MPHAGSSSVFTTPGRVSSLVVVGEQQVHHQPDHLAGREVLASGLIGQLGELADQLLIEIPHLQVRHRRRAQVDLRELRHHQIQQVVVVEAVDLHIEVELLHDVAGRLREPRDVVAQVPGHVVGIAQQRVERVPGHVHERLIGHLLQQRLAVAQCLRQVRHGLQHLGLGRLQHAVQPAQHRQRKDHPPVLGLLVHAPQQVRHRPDEPGVVLDRRAAHTTPAEVAASTRQAN